MTLTSTFRLYTTTSLVLFAAMLVSAVAHLAGAKSVLEYLSALGYPAYFSYYLGVCKIAGLSGLLLLKERHFKDWIYSGFFVILLSAIVSTIVAGAGLPNLIPPLVLLFLLVCNYYCFHKLEERKQRDRKLLRMIHKKISSNDVSSVK